MERLTRANWVARETRAREQGYEKDSGMLHCNGAKEFSKIHRDVSLPLQTPLTISYPIMHTQSYPPTLLRHSAWSVQVYDC